MVWCSSCAKNCERPAFCGGFLCCPLCGSFIDQDNFSNEPTFVKNAAGQEEVPQKAKKSGTESSHSDDGELPHITKKGTGSKA